MQNSPLQKIILLLLSLAAVQASLAQPVVEQLMTENKIEPQCIDAHQPRFTWKLKSTGDNLQQSAYELKVMKGASVVWSSAKVMSDQSVQVAYRGTALLPLQLYKWQVRVWDTKGLASGWSKAASFRMGIIDTTQWKAKWIESTIAEDALRASPYFRKSFTLKKKPASAFLYITAHGLYEANINGKKAGDAFLTPGWTSYNSRLQYQAYDVLPLLSNGKNAIGAVLGNGWYRSNLAWAGKQDIYGNTSALLCQLVISYADGSSEIIASDESWKCSTGSITFDEIYHGETIDHRKEKKSWGSAAYDDSDWQPVRTARFPFGNLIATENEPIRKHQVFTPVKVLTTARGEHVLDFGQNLVGWVVVNAKGKAGDSITIRHAEVLDKHGNFYTDNLRAAKATSRFILSGDGEEQFEPHFTFYGFRYIKIDGIRGDIDPADFSAVALYSDMPQTGTFSCSNQLVNQLQHNIQWGQNGNFLDVPTDCPQRDERLGWTGDAQVFSQTAAFNRNVNNFFSKWLKDLMADQLPNGSVPHVIPNILGNHAAGSAGWADVATIIPWNISRLWRQPAAAHTI